MGSGGGGGGGGGGGIGVGMYILKMCISSREGT